MPESDQIVLARLLVPAVRMVRDEPSRPNHTSVRRVPHMLPRRLAPVPLDKAKVDQVELRDPLSLAYDYVLRLHVTVDVATVMHLLEALY